jgi:chromosome partitioning protein
MVIAFISQKGGVGKSTLARTLAAVAAHAKLKVRVADLDERQSTLLRWARARKENRIIPSINVQGYANLKDAIDDAANDDLLIVDAAGHVSSDTVELARKADVIVQPTGPSLDDLHPAVLVFHGLVENGIAREHMAFALCRIGSHDEEDAARHYLEEAGYEVLRGAISEQVGYRQALNRGQGLTETNEKSLNEKADDLLEALLEKIAEQFDVATRRGGARRRTEQIR